MTLLAWGAKVSPLFRTKVVNLSTACKIADPSYPMACMAFESARTFRADVRNAAGSGAVGLIQFMPSTAAALSTTTELLANMTAEDQLDFVARYFAPWKGRLNNLGDVYGAILWPSMIGKSDDAILFRKDDPFHPKQYVQNRGLDFNGDGVVTRGEAVSRIAAMLAEGLNPVNAFEMAA